MRGATTDSRSSARSELADIAERLTDEFASGIDLATISAVVLAAQHDLQGSPAAARTVGLERLARRRLLALAAPPRRPSAASRHRERR